MKALDSVTLRNARGALAFCRENFRNDGAEGESVHLLCDVLETLLPTWQCSASGPTGSIVTKSIDTEGGHVSESKRRILNTEVVRKLKRDELEELLEEKGVSFDEGDSDDDLRCAIMNHEAAQACPFWEGPP